MSLTHPSSQLPNGSGAGRSSFGTLVPFWPLIRFWLDVRSIFCSRFSTIARLAQSVKHGAPSFPPVFIRDLVGSTMFFIFLVLTLGREGFWFLYLKFSTSLSFFHKQFQFHLKFVTVLVSSCFFLFLLISFSISS